MCVRLRGLQISGDAIASKTRSKPAGSMEPSCFTWNTAPEWRSGTMQAPPPPPPILDPRRPFHVKQTCKPPPPRIPCRPLGHPDWLTRPPMPRDRPAPRCHQMAPIGSSVAIFRQGASLCPPHATRNVSERASPPSFKARTSLPCRQPDHPLRHRRNPSLA